MTIKLKVAAGFSGGIGSVVAAVDAMLFDLSVTSASSTLIKLGGLGYNVKVFGTGFTFTEDYLSGGTVTGIDVNIGGADAFDFSGMSMSGGDIFNAIKAEDNLTDIAATEKLFLSERWVVTCNNNDDILTKGSKSPDGIPLNFRGNDKVALRGGNDQFFSGNGSDTVNGGSGNDTLWGGKGGDHCGEERAGTSCSAKRVTTSCLAMPATIYSSAVAARMC